jgi:hypothetical protein
LSRCLSCRETFPPFFVFFYLEVVVVIVAVFFPLPHVILVGFRTGLSSRASAIRIAESWRQAFVDKQWGNRMERSLANGVASDFLHPHSPPHHVRRHLSPTLVSERPSSPSARRRRRQRKPWRKLLWVTPNPHFVSDIR